MPEENIHMYYLPAQKMLNLTKVGHHELLGCGDENKYHLSGPENMVKILELRENDVTLKILRKQYKTWEKILETNRPLTLSKRLIDLG